MPGRTSPRTAATDALCLRADSGFLPPAPGYVGTSDGWQDFDQNGKMTWTYPRATNGNVALMGELENRSGTLALALQRDRRRCDDAGALEPRRRLRRRAPHVHSAMEDWARPSICRTPRPELRREAELSAAVIKIHEDRTYAGAMVASLSVPWGSSRDDPGGYHLVWTRDAVEAAFAMIAVGPNGRRASAPSPTSSAPRPPMAAGARTTFRAAAAIGTASSSMRSRCRSC